MPFGFSADFNSFLISSPANDNESRGSTLIKTVIFLGRASPFATSGAKRDKNKRRTAAVSGFNPSLSVSILNPPASYSAHPPNHEARRFYAGICAYPISPRRYCV